MGKPIENFNFKKVRNVILHISSEKAPGYNVILENLPKKGILSISQIFNAVLCLSYFSNQWKVAEIIILPKPEKNPNEICFYRPVSHLPLLSKVFEKLLLKMNGAYTIRKEGYTQSSIWIMNPS